VIRDWGCCLLVIAVWGSGPVQAQAPFPYKPVRFVVTSPPGGANDTLNRALGAKLTEFIGQPVVIDNRPGASGIVAAEIVAKAPPDGYTVLAGTEATLVTNPLLFTRVPYDTQRDFAPVTMTAAVSHVLRAPRRPRPTQELIAVARSKPGRLITHRRETAAPSISAWSCSSTWRRRYRARSVQGQRPRLPPCSRGTSR
jgi:tripartite-type tricarboxylate transporter receptor subunit TctC